MAFGDDLLRDDPTINTNGLDPTVPVEDPTAAPDPSGPIGPASEPVGVALPESQAPEPEVDTPDPLAEVATPAKEEEPKPFFELSDVPKALVAGTEGFLRDAYGFLDFLAFDALPDIDRKPQSFEMNSTVGQFLTEVVNFSWGFFPAAGLFGKLGAASKGFTLSSKAEKVAMRAAQIAKTADRGADAEKFIRRARGIRWGRDFAAGAVADFALYDSQEERLTSILNAVPSLDPVIPDFLAKKTDESEFRGRLAAALEGGVLGAAVESLFYSVRSLAKVRDLRAKGKSPEQIARAIADDQKDIVDSLVPGAASRPSVMDDALSQARRRREAQGGVQLTTRRERQANIDTISEQELERYDSEQLARSLNASDHGEALSHHIDQLQTTMREASIETDQQGLRELLEGDPQYIRALASGDEDAIRRRTQQLSMDILENQGLLASDIAGRVAQKTNLGKAIEQGREVPTGAEAIIKRVKAEQKFADVRERQLREGSIDPTDANVDRAAARISDSEIETVEQFIDDIGADLFSGVGVSFVRSFVSSPTKRGQFAFLSGIVTIGREAIRNGTLEDTVVHELWHHLSRFVSPEKLSRLSQQFNETRDALIARHPEIASLLADNSRPDTVAARLRARGVAQEEIDDVFGYIYRFRNMDEFFAEELTDLYLGRTWRAAGPLPEEAVGVLAAMRRIMTRIAEAIGFNAGRQRPTEEILEDFLSRRNNRMRRYAGIEFGATFAAIPDPRQMAAPGVAAGRVTKLHAGGYQVGGETGKRFTILRNADGQWDLFDGTIESSTYPNGAWAQRFGTRREALDAVRGILEEESGVTDAARRAAEETISRRNPGLTPEMAGDIRRTNPDPATDPMVKRNGSEDVDLTVRKFDAPDPGGRPWSRKNEALRSRVLDNMGGEDEVGANTMADSMDQVFRDEFGMSVRRRAGGGNGYFARLSKAMGQALADGQLGTSEIADITNTIKGVLKESEEAALNQEWIRARQALRAEHPELAPLMGGNGLSDATRRDLWEHNFTPEQVDELGDLLDRVSSPERLLSHMILMGDEAIPQGLEGAIMHGRRVFNAVADGMEVRYGSSRAKELFDAENFNTRNIVPGGNVTAADMAATARAEITDENGIKSLLDAVGIDAPPETIKAAAELDRYLRVNPRDLKALELVERVLNPRALNMKNWLTSKGFVRVMRSLERVYGGFDTTITDQEAIQRTVTYLQDMVDPADNTTFMAQMGQVIGTKEGVKQTELRLTTQMLAAKHMLVMMGESLKAALERTRTGNLVGTPEGEKQIAELALLIKKTNEVRETVSQYGTSMGRMTQKLKVSPSLPASEMTSDVVLRADGWSDAEIAAIRKSQKEDAVKAQARRAKREAPLSPEDQMAQDADKMLDEQLVLDEGRQAVADFGGPEEVLKMAKDLKGILDGQAGDIMGIVRASRVSNGPQGARSAILEYWYNSMLSSGKTFMVNLMGSLGYTMLRPIEIALGSSFTGNMQGLVRAKNEMIGLFMNLRESFKYGRAAFGANDSILLRQGSVAAEAGSTTMGAISSKNPGLHLKEGSFFGNLIDGIGSVVRLPTKGLLATDEAIKQLQFRTTLMASTAERLTLEEGLSPENAWKLAGDLLEREVRNGQAFSAKALYDRGYQLAVENGVPDGFADQQAKQYVKDNFHRLRGTVRDFAGLNENALLSAKTSTFTNELPNTGFFSVPAHIAKMAQANWLVRLAVPFVRTPTNLLFTTGQHFDVLSPIKYFTTKLIYGSDDIFKETAARRSRFIQDMVSGDSARAAEAKGRLIFGLSAFTMVGMAYGNGMITGGGPVDAAKKRAWLDAGWKPYSLRTPDGEYFSYERFDPIANILGIAADFFEVQELSQDEDDSTLERMGSAIAVAVASNLDNKTYLSGLTDFLGAIGDPRQSATNVFSRIGGSIVPTIMNDIAKAQDPYEREARTFVEKIQRRLPGLREDLPIMYNLVGEAVPSAMSAADAVVDGPGAAVLGMWTPIAYNKINDPVVDEELQSLSYGFSRASYKMGGIDMRDLPSETDGTVFNEYGRLIGETKLGGLTLREKMREVIQSEYYQGLSPESTEEVTSPRITVLQRHIRRYRRRAAQQLQIAHPELRQAMVDRVRNKRRALLGVDIGGLRR